MYIPILQGQPWPRLKRPTTTTEAQFSKKNLVDIYFFKRIAMKKSISPFTFIFRKHSSIFHILELGALCICEKKSLLITKNVNDDIISDI